MHLIGCYLVWAESFYTVKAEIQTRLFGWTSAKIKNLIISIYMFTYLKRNSVQ